MKKVFITAVTIFVLLTASAQNTDWANFGKYAEANKTVSEGAVVFMGNSITEGWVNIHPNFFANNNYVGRGISGQVTAQMLVRFRKDVIGLKPKVVVILAGTNDIAQNQGYISLDNIFGNIVSMCELAKINKIKVIVCSVLPAYQYPWRKDLHPADSVIALNNMLKEYADANKIIYIDYHATMKDERNGLPDKYSYDGIHPNQEGYLIMESLVKPAIDKALRYIKKNRL
jgi:lysophospholipase L1-like esterase